jgi:cytochrome c oxidase subunit IV
VLRLVVQACIRDGGYSTWCSRSWSVVAVWECEIEGTVGFNFIHVCFRRLASCLSIVVLASISVLVIICVYVSGTSR